MFESAELKITLWISYGYNTTKCLRVLVCLLLQQFFLAIFITVVSNYYFNTGH